MIGATAAGAQKVYVPLVFWLNRNPGLALPLYRTSKPSHEVKLSITFAAAAALAAQPPAAAPSAALYVDYIYLDTDERRRFAQVQPRIPCQ